MLNVKCAILIFALVPALLHATMARASNLSSGEVAAVKRCGYGASNYNLSNRQLFDSCRHAAGIYATHVRTADGAEEREQYLKSEALMEIYAATPAAALGLSSLSIHYRSDARAIWSRLASSGYSADIRSQSSRSIQCFFKHDMNACHSLFPR